jgi:hypothetical protein
LIGDNSHPSKFRKKPKAFAPARGQKKFKGHKKKLMDSGAISDLLPAWKEKLRDSAHPEIWALQVGKNSHFYK